MPAPVLYLSHGAPPLADDARWTRELADWSATIERPKDILMVSAHWEAAPVALSSTTGAPLLYDFWGFPQHYYEVTYAAPPAPGLAEMYPEADIPVVQLSLPTLNPRTLFAVGERLAPLREEGTLIVGSGFTTHNLSWFNPGAGPDGAPPSPSREFDHWADEAMAAQDVDSLLDMLDKAPAARQAHPRTEHWAPLYVALGAAAGGGSLANRSVIDGFWYGLSKRSWQFS